MLSSKTMNLNDWVSKCTITANQKGWGWNDGESKDPTFLSAQLMLVVTEAAEGCEDLRKGHIKTVYLEKNKELGDVYHTEQHYIEGIPVYNQLVFHQKLLIP